MQLLWLVWMGHLSLLPCRCRRCCLWKPLLLVLTVQLKDPKIDARGKDDQTAEETNDAILYPKPFVTPFLSHR